MVVGQAFKSLDRDNAVLLDLLKYPCLVAFGVVSTFLHKAQGFGERLSTTGTKESSSDKTQIAGFPTDGYPHGTSMALMQAFRFHFFHQFLFSIHHSVVCLTPSSTEYFGCQPSILFAFEQSSALNLIVVGLSDK